jgi:hypothetical protein
MAASTAFAVPELGPDDLVYLERIRQATRRLSYREVAPEDPRAALQVLRDVTHFDVEVPTASNRREVEVLKTGVKRLLAWYMRYLGVQLNNFAAATTRLGEMVVERGEKLEAGAGELEARLGALEERVRRLEAAPVPQPSAAAHPLAGADRAEGPEGLAAGASRVQPKSPGAPRVQPKPASGAPRTGRRGSNGKASPEGTKQ